MGVGVLVGPVLMGQGIIFTRDPAFLGTASADVSSSLGALSLSGGLSNLLSQGVFYTPYALFEAALRLVGFSSGTLSKVVITAVAVAGASGAFRLTIRLGGGPVAAGIASLLFLLNPWSLDQFGYFFFWTGYCMLPWVVMGAHDLMVGRQRSLALIAPLLLSGALVAWLITVLAVVVVVVGAHVAHPRHADARRRAIRTCCCVPIAGAYWILPYIVWSLVPQGTGYRILAHQASGGILQSPNSLVNVIGLRDFWWPHLRPASPAGYLADGAATLASTILVLAAVGWWAFRSRSTVPPSPQHRLRTTVLVLMGVGLVLAAGSAGPTGWAYTMLHAWPLPGHALVAGITRSPSNFAAPFVVAVAVGLGVLTTELISRGTIKKMTAFIGLCSLLLVAIVPSLLSFWTTYRPTVLPDYYRAVGAAVPSGTTLEIGLWGSTWISPKDDVAHFDWSQRMVADPTVLGSFVLGNSLSPVVSSVDLFGATLVAQVGHPRGVAIAESELRALGIASFIVEDDIERSQKDPLPEFVSEFRRAGWGVQTSGPMALISVPGAHGAPVSAAGCRVDTTWLRLGALNVQCNQPTEMSLTSPYQFDGPLFGLGVRIGAPHAIVDGVGTIVAVRTTQGWVISIPMVLVDIGFLVTFSAVLIMAGQATRRMWLTSVYGRGANRTDE
jgi:hypothetical protein